MELKELEDEGAIGELGSTISPLAFAYGHLAGEPRERNRLARGSGVVFATATERGCGLSTRKIPRVAGHARVLLSFKG